MSSPVDTDQAAGVVGGPTSAVGSHPGAARPVAGAAEQPVCLAMKPLHTAGLLCLARHRDGAGKHVTALELYERALNTGHCRPVDYFRASLTAFKGDNFTRALDILKRAESSLPAEQMNGPMWYNMGCFAAKLGRYPDALRYLNRAVDAGFDDLEKYRNDPDLNDLRWHKGFRNLLSELAAR